MMSSNARSLTIGHWSSAARRRSARLDRVRFASPGGLDASELLALAARGDAQGPAVLGDRSAGDGEAVATELLDDLLVGERVLLVLLGDDLQQLLLDRVPGDLPAVGG